MAVRTLGRSGTLDSAVRVGLRLLAARSRSRHELRLALQRRGFTARQQNAALARLDLLGYLDDARFARQRAATLLSNGFGPRSVLSRLLAHGLTDAEAKRGLRESESEIGFNELEAPADRKSLARAARLLGARGFSEEVISRLIGQAALDSERQDD